MFPVVQLTQKIRLVHFSLVPGAVSAVLLPIFFGLLIALDHTADAKINGSNMCSMTRHGKTGRDLEHSPCREKCTALKAACLLSCLQMKIMSFRMKLKQMQHLREVRLKIPRRDPLSAEMNHASA